ncbi:hemerythrin domain-containing protein [Streptomyces sp. NPDC052036]|uniref:hemerythrin domain-containing protein n=1 Tax=Streptomyces sp. NPDC052036 TaxID=3155171 RepID=UPI003437F470
MSTRKRRLTDQYLTLDDLHQRERVLKQAVQLVFSHAFAEETVLWPAVRASVPDGEELTARVEEEHQLNDLVADIERLPASDPGREERVQWAFALIRQDIRDEEDLLLSRSLPIAGHDGYRPGTLGTTWAAVRQTAPTHPHPVIPRRPPGNALLGVPLSDALGIGSSASRRRR